jgi:hypothetical protein
MSSQSSNRLNIPSSMKEALGRPQKSSDSSVVIKGKIDKTKVDNPAVHSSKVENPAAQSLASSKGNYISLYYYNLYFCIMMIELY